MLRPHDVQLIWATQDAEPLIVEMARVSAPKNAKNMETGPKLLRYLIKHKHWSPFQMASMCLQIHTTRAISPQILRHSSFGFQEFCLAGDARITVVSEAGIVQRIPISKLYQKWQSPRFKARYARAYDTDLERFINAPIKSVYSSGKKPVYRFCVEGPASNRKIHCTREHRVLTKERGFVSFGVAFDEGLTVALNGAPTVPLAYQDPQVLADNAWMGSNRFAKEYGIAEVTARKTLCAQCHRDHDCNVQGKVYGWTLGMTAKWGRITSQDYLGIQETFDIEMDHPTHNFVADGVVVHNSQRYANSNAIGSPAVPHLRSQDNKNRQNSTDDLPERIGQDKLSSYYRRISNLFEESEHLYQEMISAGIAKECARSVLPLAAPTKLFMAGTLRSWLHYIDLRTANGTQLEHKEIAEQCKTIFTQQFPIIAEAMWPLEQEAKSN